ncbi:MAG: GNAT family N-acetyltransferase [Ruminococcaceae bacterium]|nr:GNAT family N-acetyltransferase [Oscillospiraceae bacterium]
MNIIHGYRSDKGLRDSFNALAEQTFDGLNFEGWYQNGFWGDNYDPHSIVLDGKVAANVSVNRTDLMIGGKRYKILQLGTVMTAPEHRGRGYGREIMEYIDREYADVDGIYLFGNDSVVDYYPKFGFRPGREMEYRKAVSQTGENKAVQVRMNGPAGWSRLAEAMGKSTFREGCRMVDNPGLIFFYVSQFMQEAVWHLPELDAWAVAELEDGTLTLHNVFADASVTVDDVVEAFGTEVKDVVLGFAPEHTDGWELRELREEDCHFFVKGAVFGEFEERQLRIPSLSHA